MKEDVYVSTATTKKGYMEQIIYYYNTGIGRKSDISGVTITEKLISTVEKRYKELGGSLPIKQEDIDARKGKGWKHP